jgi:hypothetical protein
MEQSSKNEQAKSIKIPLAPIMAFHMRGLYLSWIYDVKLEMEHLGLIKRSRFRRFFVNLKQQKLVRLTSCLLPVLMLLFLAKPVLAVNYLNQANSTQILKTEADSTLLKRKKRLLLTALITTVLIGCTVGYCIAVSNETIPMSTRVLLERQYGLYKIPPFVSSPRIYSTKKDLECNLTQLLNYMTILDQDARFGTIKNRASTKSVLTAIFWKVDALLKVSTKLKLSNHPKIDIAQKTFQELCKKDTFLLMYCKKLLATYYPAKVKNDSAAINLQLEMLKVLLARTPD